MRRWNGWGDDTITYPLHDAPRRFLEELVGPGTPPRDAGFEEVVTAVPPSQLPAHPLVSGEPGDRVRHARGQSLPDWIALRSGRVAAFPDGVAYPTTDAEVRALLRYAGEVGAGGSASARRTWTRLWPQPGASSSSSAW